MTDRDENKPRKLPRKFRASSDPADASGFALLSNNDAQQAELGAIINAPFTAATSLQNARSRALITIEAYSRPDVEHTDGSIEVLAEAYATVGEYKLAAELSKTKKDEYKATQKAIDLADNKWCEHSDEHKYIKAYLYSIKHGREMTLLACNECGHMNMTDAPDHLHDRETQQRAIAGSTNGMNIAQALAWHHQRFGRPK